MINFIKSIFTKNPSAKIRKTLDQKYKTSVELQRNGKLREYAEVMKEIEDLEEEYLRAVNENRLFSSI